MKSNKQYGVLLLSVTKPVDEVTDHLLCQIFLDYHICFLDAYAVKSGQTQFLVEVDPVTPRIGTFWRTEDPIADILTRLSRVQTVNAVVWAQCEDMLGSYKYRVLGGFAPEHLALQRMFTTVVQENLINNATFSSS